jgi:hypothetical protein
MKIRSVGAELLHAETGRQAGRQDKANARFSQFFERA